MCAIAPLTTWPRPWPHRSAGGIGRRRSTGTDRRRRSLRGGSVGRPKDPNANRPAQRRFQRICVECGELRLHQGHGLCDRCYSRQKRRTHHARSLAWEQAYRDRNRERERRRLREYSARTPEKQMIHAAKWRAQRARVPFDLTERDIHIPSTCPVLGIPIQRALGRANENSPALDRVVPCLGYVRGNVRVISGRANTLKRDGTLEEFRALAAYLEDHGLRARPSEVA